MVVTPITRMLAVAQADFGLDLADGTPVQITLQNDFPIEDDTLQDVYRHDFLVMIEYPITTQDQLFAVLAPVQSFETRIHAVITTNKGFVITTDDGTQITTD